MPSCRYAAPRPSSAARCALGLCLLVAVARREARLDRRQTLLHHRAAVLEREELGGARARAESSPARARSTSTAASARAPSASAGARERLLERALRDRRRLAAHAPGPAAAEAVAGSGEDHQVGLRERELHRGAPAALDEHHAGEHASERVLEPGNARADAVDERSCARWREPRLRARRELVDDEQQARRLAGAEALDGARRRVAAVDHNGAQCLAERGDDRGLRTRLDLQQVDQRPDDAGQPGEVLHPGGRARRAEAEFERVGARPPARGLGLGRAPRFVGRAQRALCSSHVPHLRRRRGGNVLLDLRQLRAQHTGVGHERLEHACVGGGRELTLHAAVLLAEQRVEAARALAQGLQPHERRR